ncbi:MAG TPA: hypothetical protein VMZ28_25605, partial [Kofleriaceae bacterium]|nr:hypothetical protein [Kofleriaceae bacterium]
ATADAAPPPAHAVDAGAVTARPHPHPRPSAADTQPTAASGQVRLSSTPWARVRVVGRKEACAETPCTLSLPAGRHTIELDNPVAHLRKTIAVEVTAGATLTRREALTERP